MAVLLESSGDAAMKFYTYIHLTGDKAGMPGQVFYVGKGSGNRAYSKARNKFWKNVVEKHGHTVVVCAYWDSEQEALEHERFLVLCFRDLGYKLTNLTEGGGGIVGWRHSEECKERMSQSRMGHATSSDTKEAIAAKHLGRKVANTSAMSLAAKLRCSDPEYLKKLSDAKKGKKASEETKRKQSEAKLGNPKSDSTKANMRAAWVLRKARKKGVPHAPE